MRWKTALGAAAVVCLLIPLGLLFAGIPGEGDFGLFQLVESKDGEFSLLVDRGSAKEAADYYKDIQAPLKLDLSLKKTTVDQVLQYLGHGDLKAVDLEQKASTGGDILTTRFFAPKIIDVSGRTPLSYGWRKIVRLHAKKGSPADKAGIGTFYLMFNFDSGNEPVYPAGQHAGQIQAMLIPASYPVQDPQRDVYFFVFNSLDGKCPDGKPCPPGSLGDHLRASFDFGGLSGPGNKDEYFVPRSCGQCHGTKEAKQEGGKVNYLDSDHWFDRVQPGEEFAKVKKANVLVDGGEPAFQALRVFNQEIRDQNKAVHATFQLAAVENWLKRHQSSSGHLAPIDRPIPPSAPGKPVWTKGNPQDEALLPMLNRNCFRCHSSMVFHVFDKEAVYGRAGKMMNLIRLGVMPQDRRLCVEARQEISKLLSEMVPTVTIENYEYKPAELKIQKGQCVQWTNKDDAEHTATRKKAPSPFDTGYIKKGETSKPICFDDVGEFDYYCTPHPDMTGTIEVVNTP
jgi:plastocyanin